MTAEIVSSNTLKIAIIGGGIGGSAAALSLLKAGFDVQVYEQAPELREVGAGIVLTPNAVRVLRWLRSASRRPGGGSGAGTMAAHCCIRRSRSPRASRRCSTPRIAPMY